MATATTRRRRFGNALCATLCGMSLGTLARAEPLAGSDPDLSVAAVRHWAECPLPREGGCVIRKPVDTGYRVLTSGAVVDDLGEQWLVDFTKAKKAGTDQLLLRVLGRNGELHEILVNFPSEPAPPPKPTVKKKQKKRASPKAAPAPAPAPAAKTS